MLPDDVRYMSFEESCFTETLVSWWRGTRIILVPHFFYEIKGEK